MTAALVPLATEVRGTGPGLLLLHGITEDHTSWGPVADLLLERAIVVSVDLRGHGESARAASYRLADMAADVHAAWVASGIAGAPLLDDTPGELDGMVEDVTAGVRVPFLSVHGLDPGPDDAEWLTARIPTATVEVWTTGDGAPLGHHPHLLQPERFVARVREFDAALPA